MPESVPALTDLTGMSLADIAEAVAARRLPPVAQWEPTHCGDSHMRISADGSWFHEGGRIERPAMVRLFASLLRREPDGHYVLVTPVEKLSIEIEDMPFAAVEVRSEGAGRDRRLAFRLNTDEAVIAGPDHPLRFDGSKPSLEVRAKLEARIARPIYYELAEMALSDAHEPPGLWSDDSFFAMDRA